MMYAGYLNHAELIGSMGPWKWKGVCKGDQTSTNRGGGGVGSDDGPADGPAEVWPGGPQAGGQEATEAVAGLVCASTTTCSIKPTSCPVLILVK